MIRIANPIIEKIKIHAEQLYPDECCGMLIGYDDNEFRVIKDAMQIDNRQDENRNRRFFITPDQYRFAELYAKKNSSALLGFYHSHPDHPAAPSSFDTEHALPWFTYIIVSVNHCTSGIITAWQLNDEQTKFFERDLIIDPLIVQPEASGFVSFHTD